MKTFKPAVLATAFSLLALAMASVAFGADGISGTWTIQPSRTAGMVHFGLTHRDGKSHSQHDSDWPVKALEGLDLATPGRHDVNFAVNREAGRILCEGFVKHGEGAGTFRFEPSTSFVPAMSKLGFGDIDEYKQFAMTIFDVTPEFARTMKAEKLDDFDTDKLIAFRIFDVNPQFIRDMRAAGLPARSSDTLIAFRVHGVSPAVVNQFRRNGFELSEDQLIAFRVHEVTPEYADRIEAAGLGRPDADQLIAMKVHGITPEYIAQMKARGLKNLSLDRLVALKVHGID